MKKLLLFAFLLVGQVALAQKFSIKGRVLDEKDSPLPSTTVLLLHPKDSTLVSFTSSDAQGAFELKNINKGTYLLKISFVSYRSLYQTIETPEMPGPVEMGLIRMKPATNALGEVLVKGEQDPVTIKKDTLEFNAGSFKTQPNAAVEELLKKLPGVQVETDGSVSVQGEKVKRVTVDGKEFFGKDPKIATKNLPADAVNKVQVYDKKSDQADFSGIDDGQRTKTINLELKEDRKNSMFGNAMAGAGTNSRFQSKFNLNRFQKGKQFSVLGMGNNVNTQGFGIDEYLAFSGGMQQMASGGRFRIEIGGNSGIPLNNGGRTNGLMRTYGGGLNFAQSVGKNTEVNGNYFFNHLNHDVRSTIDRDEVRPTGPLEYTQSGSQENTNTNHRLNLAIDHKIDSANSVKFTTSLVMNQTEGLGNSLSETRTGEGQFQNRSDSKSNATGQGQILDASLLLRHKFPKKGRTLSFTTQASLNNNDNENRLTGVNEYASQPRQEINQFRVNETNSYNYSGTLNATEPLGNRRYLEATYLFNQNHNASDQQVYDLQEGERVLNQSQSNRYNSDFRYHRAGVNFRINRDAFSFAIGPAFQRSELVGYVRQKENMPVRKTFTNVLPTARFNYEFSNNRRVEVDYETSIQEPSVRQLQPLPDSSNLLNVYVGNPGLRPAYQHQVRVNFSMFNPTSMISFFAFGFLDYTTDAITNSVRYDQNLVRTTQPVNVKYSRMSNLNLSLGYPLRKLKSRLNVGASVQEQQGINLIDEIATTVDNRTYSGNLRYEYRLDQKFDLSLRSELSLQTTDYNAEGSQNQRFVNQTYSGETNVYLPHQFYLTSTLEYLVYHNPQLGFRQNIPLLNASIAKQFLKNNSGELRLTAVNLLDQNLGITQTIGPNYVQTETLNSLGRYFMLQFTYSLNKHLNPMAGRGGIRIVR
ncbi:outer membrane beta-barrel family protein [Rufibacter hautae]|uniref:Outer membrane beta-barrel protein n=1 Tax=Rufibacter hautae TaxID=2595005 RepID=A0A5B6TGK3_9BACT|nr:outer membrane beta-barrel family protein [Rufibacter hautae]KAA3438392.1 outer membrane beta-barrel protein [Rufibacter hautae]